MTDLLNLLIERVRNEPVVVAGVVAAAIVLLAGHFGIVLDKPTITSVLTPIVVAIVTRFKVTPNHKVSQPTATS